MRPAFMPWEQSACQAKEGSPSSGTPFNASVCSCASFCAGVMAASSASTRDFTGRVGSSHGRLPGAGPGAGAAASAAGALAGSGAGPEAGAGAASAGAGAGTGGPAGGVESAQYCKQDSVAWRGHFFWPARQRGKSRRRRWRRVVPVVPKAAAVRQFATRMHHCMRGPRQQLLTLLLRQAPACCMVGCEQRHGQQERASRSCDHLRACRRPGTSVEVARGVGRSRRWV